MVIDSFNLSYAKNAVNNNNTCTNLDDSELKNLKTKYYSFFLFPFIP